MVMPYISLSNAQRALSLASQRAGSEGLLIGIEDTKREGFIRVANAVFAKSQSPWFGYMAEDAYAGRNWMAIALEAIGKRGAQFLGFNDGKWHGALASFGLASRAWAVKNYAGNFFYPEYKSHYADTELTLLALQEGVYVYEPSSVLVEVDWVKERAKVSATDKALFHERKSTGFDARVSEKKLLEMFS